MVRLDDIERRENEILKQRVRLKADIIAGGHRGGIEGGGERDGGSFGEGLEAEREGGGPEGTGMGFGVTPGGKKGKACQAESGASEGQRCCCCGEEHDDGDEYKDRAV